MKYFDEISQMIRQGDKNAAIKNLVSILQKDISDADAWFLLGEVIDDPVKKRDCYNNVLKLFPDNKSALQRISLLELSKKTPEENIKKSLQGTQPLSRPKSNLETETYEDLQNVSKNSHKVINSDEVLDNKGIEIQALKCPMCGAGVTLYARECTYCGSILIFTSYDTVISGKSDSQLLTTSINKWKSILRKDPNNPEAIYALGLYYLNLKLTDASRQYLQKAALLTPDSAIVQYNLALALTGEGTITTDSEEYKNAEIAIDYATRLDPKLKEAEAFKHYFSAKRLDLINLSEAIEEYKKAIDLCPDISMFHNCLGFDYSLQENYPMAEKSFFKAIEIDPECVKAYGNCCVMYYKMGKFEEGVRIGKKAIEHLNPSISDTQQANAYNAVAFCLYRLNRIKEAIEMVEHAVALQPNDLDFRDNLRVMSEKSK